MSSAERPKAPPEVDTLGRSVGLDLLPGRLEQQWLSERGKPLGC